MIREIDVTREMYLEAKRREKEAINTYGNRGTLRVNYKEQKLNGYIGEVGLETMYHPLFVKHKDYSIDYEVAGESIDCKEQQTNKMPQLHYDCTMDIVRLNSLPADWMVFVRTKKDATKVWVCGIINTQRFIDIGKFIPAGTKNGNFVWLEDRKGIVVADLIDLDKWLFEYGALI